MLSPDFCKTNYTYVCACMQHMDSCVCIVCNPSFETGYHVIQVSPGVLIPLPLFSTVLLEVPRVLLSLLLMAVYGQMTKMNFG